ncbi:MAG: hypothetical protein A2Y31_06020 [Spirochaetes bacterium GWC2_52_13]|nr:MAG: hypothetical protein A2Y31_06020 [Spirochaetes bacterium GWC2_52_13]HCG64118.1 hypothetical protein [Sphaerochaeta sp.]
MKKRYIFLLVLLVVIVVGAVGVRSFIRKSEVALNQLSALSIANPDLSKIADGIYEGSYEAFPVKVVVTVEVADHRIVSVELNEHRNGQGKPAESLLPHIVATQSLELDAVAGATYSSKVILKAVEQALLQGR